MLANKYPPWSFYFKVVFSGGKDGKPFPDTSFQEVSGLSVSMEPEVVTEGGNLWYTHRLPKTPTYSNLVLKRGFSTGTKLKKWVMNGLQSFEFDPKTVVVSLMNEQSTPMQVWKVYNVRPVKWAADAFDSTKNSVAVETLELAFDYFESEKG